MVFYKRGKARGAMHLQAKNHIRISLGKDLTGQTIRKYLHVHIVETQIRPLKAGEIVHHIDENKHNNSLDNLQILENQAEHKRLHCFLDRQKVYEPDLSDLTAEEKERYYEMPF